MRDILFRTRKCYITLDRPLKSTSPINTCLIRDKVIVFFFSTFTHTYHPISQQVDRCTREVQIEGSREYRRTSAPCPRVDRHAVRSQKVLVIGENRILQSKIYDGDRNVFAELPPFRPFAISASRSFFDTFRESMSWPSSIITVNSP